MHCGNVKSIANFFPNMSSLSWRSIYFLSIGLRFVFALSNSYIHPDEHFQGFEVVAAKVLGYNTNIPWEFSSDSLARSYAPLVLFYYPILKALSFFNVDFLPLQLWYIVRLQFMLVSWMVTDWCLYRMLPTKQERIKAIFFVLTSYVSLVYQSHCFSNSIETILLVLAVYMINELRFLQNCDLDQYEYRDLAKLAGGLGLVVAVGVFNRVTFPAFLVLPAFYLVQSYWKWKLLVFVSGIVFAAAAAAGIILDSVMCGTSLSLIANDATNWSQYVVAPWNNLVYNAKYENLAHHGIHPYYTHIIVNLPQLMGPGLVFLFYGFRNRYWKTTPFLSAMSGLLFLSVVPHQELRFLIPVVPLLCCCFDVALFARHGSLLMNLWFAFNTVLAVVMGVLHQGGVVPALEHLHELNEQGVTQIWWRTYSPPTWMLADTLHSTQFITINDENSEFSLDPNKQNYVFDTMGTDFEKVERLISSLKSKIYVVTPIASFAHFNSSLYNQTWKYDLHLDLDHLDFTSYGLGIYELL